MLDEIIEDLSKYLNEKIEDIIIFGSVMRGKENPNDIDIIIIFKEFNDKLYLELGKNYHIIPLTIDSLYNINTILIEALAEGFSVKYSKPLREILGFRSYKEFVFKEMKFKEKSKKILFYYFLNGRKDRNKKGIIEELNAKIINKNPYIIRVPIDKSEIFKKKIEIFSKLNNIEFEIEERTIIIGRVNINFYKNNT
ncbi:nucleotidyltransferase [Nanoarchaeota archaeon]